jgi:hypothetical protein
MRAARGAYCHRFKTNSLQKIPTPHRNELG